jgi:hypothetical protein
MHSVRNIDTRRDRDVHNLLGELKPPAVHRQLDEVRGIVAREHGQVPSGCQREVLGGLLL